MMNSSSLTGTRAFFDAPWKCHAVGVLLSIVLIVAIGAVKVGASGKSKTIQVGNYVLEMHEVERLMNDSCQWEKDCTDVNKTEQILAREIHEIKMWLRVSPDWERERLEIYSLANRLGIHEFVIRDGQEVLGEHLSLKQFHCKTNASYQAICRLVHLLSEQEKPVHCSRIKLANTSREAAASSSLSNHQVCEAELEFQIPYVQSDSTAMELLTSEMPEDKMEL